LVICPEFHMSTVGWFPSVMPLISSADPGDQEIVDSERLHERLGVLGEPMLVDYLSVSTWGSSHACQSKTRHGIAGCRHGVMLRMIALGDGRAGAHLSIRAADHGRTANDFVSG
jgi:hypothetical protein